MNKVLSGHEIELGRIENLLDFREKGCFFEFRDEFRRMLEGVILPIGFEYQFLCELAGFGMVLRRVHKKYFGEESSGDSENEDYKKEILDELQIAAAWICEKSGN